MVACLPQGSYIFQEIWTSQGNKVPRVTWLPRVESRTAIAPGLNSFWATLLGHLHLTTEPLAFSLEPSRFRLLKGKGGGILLEQSTDSSVPLSDSRRALFHCFWEHSQSTLLHLPTKDTNHNYFNGAAAILKPQKYPKVKWVQSHVHLGLCKYPGAWLPAWREVKKNEKRKQKCHFKERVGLKNWYLKSQTQKDSKSWVLKPWNLSTGTKPQRWMFHSWLCITGCSQNSGALKRSLKTTFQSMHI